MSEPSNKGVKQTILRCHGPCAHVPRHHGLQLISEPLDGWITMWNLDDSALYFKLLCETIPYAFTWGEKDREKREKIRAAIASKFPNEIPQARWWAFRLYAKKGGHNGYDVENIPKLIVDAFSGTLLRQDDSSFHQLELYADDKVGRVAMVQVRGEAFEGGDSRRIEIFGRRA